ncbi:uncharacterized protein LOC144226072 [Crocuta crocuta]
MQKVRRSHLAPAARGRCLRLRVRRKEGLSVPDAAESVPVPRGAGSPGVPDGSRRQEARVQKWTPLPRVPTAGGPARRRPPTPALSKLGDSLKHSLVGEGRDAELTAETPNDAGRDAELTAETPNDAGHDAELVYCPPGPTAPRRETLSSSVAPAVLTTATKKGSKSPAQLFAEGTRRFLQSPDVPFWKEAHQGRPLVLGGAGTPSGTHVEGWANPETPGDEPEMVPPRRSGENVMSGHAGPRETHRDLTNLEPAFTRRLFGTEGECLH